MEEDKKFPSAVIEDILLDRDRLVISFDGEEPKEYYSEGEKMRCYIDGEWVVMSETLEEFAKRVEMNGFVELWIPFNGIPDCFCEYIE